MKKIVLISCVSKKVEYRTTARDLYISTLFKLNLRYAEQLRPDNIFILSAKYGLLPLSEEVEPYELTLNTMSSNDIKTWAGGVLQQLSDRYKMDACHFTFLAGEKYRKHLIPHTPHADIPLQGLRIGEQLQKLKGLIS